jgi:hypothetical protein
LAAIVDFTLPTMRLTTSPLNRGIERPPVDRRERSTSLCVAAEAAVVKGDLDLAQRLLIQADVDDPRCTDPGERLQWLESQKNRFDEVRSDPQPKGSKFDFLYAPTLRGLSTELSSLLPLHPNIFAVSKGELDRALEAGSETALLAKYQHRSLIGRDSLRAGLVQHAFIAGQLAGPEVAERLASLTTRKLFVHGVRDPVSLVISDFNHELIAQHCGGYVFWPMYRRMPFRSVYSLADTPRYKCVRTLRRRAGHWRARAASQGVAILAEWLLERRHSALSLDKTLIEARLTEALSRPRHFAVGHTYSRNFDAWVPINLERSLHPERGVVNRVFETVAVDATFKHPAFRASEGTRIHRLMVQNWIGVDAWGHTLFLGLGLADRMMFSNTFPLCEILPFDPDERFVALGFGAHPLCVTMHRAQWSLLPRDIRIRLVESDKLIKFRDSILIPTWLKSYAIWKSTMANYLIQELDSATMSRLRARTGADLERFLKRHPQFEQLWPSTRTLLGH